MEQAIDKVAALLPLFAFRYTKECDLHAGIARVLSMNQVVYETEYKSGADRFDFFIPPGIVIEAKVKGSLPQALPQIRRYAENKEVCGIILVTTRAWGRAETGITEINAKPFRLVHLRGASF